MRGGKGRIPKAEINLLTIPSGVSCNVSASSFSRTFWYFSRCLGVSHIPALTGTASCGGSQKSQKEKMRRAEGGRLGCFDPTLLKSVEGLG